MKLSDDEAYEVAKEKLCHYFEPKINRTFEIYNFRKTIQLESETIDSYHTRLKESAARCSFNDAKDELKHQIVFGCRSDRLRRKALRDAYLH